MVRCIHHIPRHDHRPSTRSAADIRLLAGRHRRVAAGRGQTLASLAKAGRTPHRHEWRARYRVCRVGPARQAGGFAGRLQPVAHPAHAPAPRMWRVGAVCSPSSPRPLVQVRGGGGRWSARRQNRSLRPRNRAATRQRRPCMCAPAEHPCTHGRSPHPARRAHGHLRGARRFVAPARWPAHAAHLGRSGNATRALCRMDGVHPPGVAARQRAPVLRVLGLSAHGPVRTHGALWLARGVSPLC